MKKKHFLFGPNQVNLNQGSHPLAQLTVFVRFLTLSKGAYGSHPRSIRDAMRHWQDAAEYEPDKFIRFTFPKKMHEIRRQVASFLNADVDNTVFVPNATTGLNTALRNLRFQPGDIIVYFRGLYGAIGKTVNYLMETTPVQGVEIEYDAAKDSDAEVLSRFRGTLKKYGDGVKVAIFDTVMSMPGVKMPFEQLTQICREHGVFSLIDGAHGIGFIDLNLKELDPDFFVSNCHK